MIRTQVQMQQAQYQALKELAAQQSVSISQLVRDGVDHVLSQQRNEKDKWEQLFEAVGSCQSEDGQTDVSEQHDKYLATTYQ